MADEEKKETETEAEVADAVEIVEEKKGSSKLLFILIPVILVAGLAGGFFLTSFFKGKAQPEHGQKEGESASDAEKKEEFDPKKIAFINIPDVLVNLKSNSKRPIFLKIAIVLETHDPTKKDAIENLKPKIIDQMQTFLRDLDVADVTGANNLQRLRQELNIRINNIINPLKINDVLVKEFLVQ